MPYDRVFPGSRAGGIDCGFRSGGHDLAAIGGPSVDGGLFGVQMQGVRFDFDGVAGEDTGGLSAATKHHGVRGLDVAEMGDDATGEFQIIDLSETSLSSGWKKQWAVNHLGVLEVCLDGANRKTMVEQGGREIDASAPCDSPTPHEGLRSGTIGALTAAEKMDEGNEWPKRKTEDGAAFGCVDQLAAGFAGAARNVGGVFRCAGEISTLHLHAEVTIEVDRDAGCRIRIEDRLVLIAIDTAIERMKVAIAAVDINARIYMFRAALSRLSGAESRSAKTDQS